MTDDLVKRAKALSAMIHLGEKISWGQDTAMIDALADEITRLRTKNKHLEAKLAKAVEALLLARDGLNGLVDSNDAFDVCSTTLAELKGMSDE
jgi:hypothetical protein